MEKADAPLMRCFRMTLPCVSMTHTATGTAARDAAVSTRSAIVFARVKQVHDESPLLGQSADQRPIRPRYAPR